MSKISDLNSFLHNTRKIEKKSIEEMLGGDNVDYTINILNQTQVVLTQPKNAQEIQGVIDSAVKARRSQIKSNILSILESNEVMESNKEFWVERFCVLNSVNVEGLSYDEKVAYADKYIAENPKSVEYIIYLLEQELVKNHKK